MKFGNSIHKYISRRHNLLCASLAFATVLGVPAGTASAQDTSDEIEKLNQKVELLNAKTSLANARLDYANVIFEQLPSFSGETTTDDNTGKFEATILSADAMSIVAQQFSMKATETVTSPKILVLADDEDFHFGTAFAINAEMRDLKAAAPDIGCVFDCGGGDNKILGIIPPVPIAAVTALAGMLRSETKLTTLTADAMDSRKLATAVAADLNSSGKMAFVLGGSPGTIAKPEQRPELDATSSWLPAEHIASKYLWLFTARNMMELRAKALGNSKARKKQKEKLNSWIERFDKFNARVSTADSNGNIALLNAIQASVIQDDLAAVMRVDVELAGGSLKNTKNIATFFGVDPLRVTGGVLASYVIFDTTDAGQSRPTGWGRMACSTPPIRLRKVKSLRFKVAGGSAAEVAQCRMI